MRYIHLLINVFWLILHFSLLILTHEGFFTVPERLTIIDVIGFVFLFILLHILYIIIKVKELKWQNLITAGVTLAVYIYFNGDFNPF
jgi:hypothetical protein